jgi:hypothetical protein
MIDFHDGEAVLQKLACLFRVRHDRADILLGINRNGSPDEAEEQGYTQQDREERVFYSYFQTGVLLEWLLVERIPTTVCPFILTNI